MDGPSASTGGYSPRSSSTSGAIASSTGSTDTTSSTLPHSPHSTISLRRGASASSTLLSHSGHGWTDMLPPRALDLVTHRDRSPLAGGGHARMPGRVRPSMFVVIDGYQSGKALTRGHPRRSPARWTPRRDA